MRDRPANLPPAREVPVVGKSAALERFRRMHPAPVSIEKDAFSIAAGPVHQREPRPVRAQACEPGDERIDAEAKELRKAQDISLLQPHKPRVPAAVSGALALIVDVAG